MTMIELVGGVDDGKTIGIDDKLPEFVQMHSPQTNYQTFCPPVVCAATKRQVYQRSAVTSVPP